MGSCVDRATKRLQKQAEKDQRIMMLHQKYPELKRIDEAIAANGRIMLSLAIGKVINISKQELEEKQEHLLRKQKLFLEQVGLDIAIYEVQWDCPLCQDRGYIYPGQKCTCAIQESKSLMRKHSGLALLQLEQTFDNFSFEYYANPEYYKNIFEKTRSFANKLNSKEFAGNLLLYGDVGTGKTHLCSAIANQVIEVGCQVIYIKSSRLFTWLRNQMFDYQKVDDPIEYLCQADLLILDDLGTENRSDFVEEQLYNLIDERIIQKKSWVISTNFTIEELCKRYDERLTDRILGEAKRLRFEETSIRRQKIQE